MPPVACGNPWLEHGHSSDYYTHQFQARAFKWQRPGAYHDGRICFYAGIQHVDSKCSRSSFVPYPDFVRHLDLLNQTGHTNSAAAQAHNTIGFQAALQPAFESTVAMHSGAISHEVDRGLKSQSAASKNITAVAAASQALLNILQSAAALPDDGRGTAPVLYFGLTGDSSRAAGLALTQHLWPFYKVCTLLLLFESFLCSSLSKPFLTHT